jgi:hypothetical protein
MKSKEWLFEAEQNVAKKKIDQQLDQLSDQEIDALLSVIDKSLDEGRFDYNPLAGPAPGQSQTPKPQQQKPKQPQPQQQKKSEPQKQQPKPKSEVKAYVDDLGAKEKEALKAVLQKENEQRAETGEKVSAPPKSPSELKKWLGVLLVSMAIGGVIGKVGDMTSDKVGTPNEIIQTLNNDKPVTGLGNGYTVAKWLDGDKSSPYYQPWMSDKTPSYREGKTFVTVKGDTIKFNIHSQKFQNYDSKVKFIPGSSEIFSGKITKKTSDIIQSQVEKVEEPRTDPSTKRKWIPVTRHTFTLNLKTKEFTLVRENLSMNPETNTLNQNKETQEWKGQLQKFEVEDFKERKLQAYPR